MTTRIPIAALALLATLLLLGGDTAAQGRRSVTTYGSRGVHPGPVPQAPVRIESHHRRHWVPGHYEWKTQRVRVPGWTERVWIEPLYEWRVDYRGLRFQVLVRPGAWQEVHHSDRYEIRRVRVWEPGHWEYDRGRCR